jgi:hypothetical protein
MTGKDEWRMIHATNGVLTDSKVQTQKNQDTKNKGPFSTYLGEVAGLGQTLPPGANGQAAGTTNPALRRRASEGGDPTAPGGAGGMAGIAGQPIPGQPGQPAMPGMPPGQTAINQPTLQAGFPNQPGGVAQPGAMLPGVAQPGAMLPGVVQPGMQPGFGQPPVGVAGQIIPGGRGVPGVAGSAPPGSTSNSSGGSSYLGGGSSYLGGGSYLGGQPSNPTGVGVVGAGQQPIPGMPGMPPGAFPPGTPVNSQTGGVAPVYNTAAGSNGQPPAFNQPGVNISPQAQNAAAQMIGQILTQPRPGGMPMGNAQGANAMMGTGIVGFASTADQDSIMVYNDQTNYGLWEFIFDPAKQKLPVNLAGGGQVGTPASQMGSQIGTPANQVGQPVAPSPFSGGFGAPPQTPQGGRQQ